MFNISIGTKVVNKSGITGTIISLGEHISVQYDDKIAKYANDAFIKGYLKFEDEELQKEVDILIAEAAADAKKKAEEQRKHDEEVAAQRKKEAEEKPSASKGRSKGNKEDKKSKPIHPYINKRRLEQKPAVFMVCQKDNYFVESNDGYIWAPEHKVGTDPASHSELEKVKKGDIIVHHFANKIFAISVAQNDCEFKAATVGHPNAGQIGRYVELSYHFLSNQTDTSSLKNEKAMYGSMTYGPFDKNGNNKQGFYLSELADEIAKLFIAAAIAANPTDNDLKDINNMI